MNKGLFLAIAFGALALWGLFLSLSGQGETLGPWVFQPPPPRTAPVSAEDQQDISRIAFDGRDLWLLTVSGRLWRVGPASKQAVQVPLAAAAEGMCAAGGQVVAVTEAPDRRSWRLDRFGQASQTPLQIAKSPGEHFAGMACEPSGAVIVSSYRLLISGRNGTQAIQLQGQIPLRSENSVLATEDAVWVGSNIGEFGGGLRRIDRKTGKVEVIHRNLSRALCGGPLNTECDPVTALAPRPGRPDCVLASIGLVHMSSRGRLVEVCGQEPRRLMVHPCPEQPKGWRRTPGDDEPACSAAIFGLVQTGRRLVAVSNLGLMDIAQDGAHVMAPLPRFETFGPFQLSFHDPDYVLALTEANGRFSLSGQTPLITGRR